MSCRPRNDSSCASFGTDGGVQFFVNDKRGAAIVPRLVFDCLTATKGRSSSEESSESESDDSTTRWRPFFFFFLSFFFGLVFASRNLCSHSIMCCMESWGCFVMMSEVMSRKIFSIWCSARYVSHFCCWCET